MTQLLGSDRENEAGRPLRMSRGRKSCGDKQVAEAQSGLRERERHTDSPSSPTRAQVAAAGRRLMPPRPSRPLGR